MTFTRPIYALLEALARMADLPPETGTPERAESSAARPDDGIVEPGPAPLPSPPERWHRRSGTEDDRAPGP